MNIVFVSNYINHHQLPFCKEMLAQNEGDFFFIQTEKMEAERLTMGWSEEDSRYDFVLRYYETPEKCQRLIDESDVVIFGGASEEEYIENRLQTDKITLRYSERIYKEGQWKFISPRGLKKKYHDHVRYRNKNVYLLCAGAYVASDFHLIHAYPNKMYVWGYFPEIYTYAVDELQKRKQQMQEKDGRIHILWCGRMIDWKHPEAAIHLAKWLKQKQNEDAVYLENGGYRPADLPFHLTMAGGGEMEESLKKMVKKEGLEKDVEFTGYLSPDEVREKMLDSDIFLFTSDYKEGWGAVLNEAMNSGCAVVASSGIGAVPFLLRHKYNGMVYRCNREKEMFSYVKELLEQPTLRESLGLNAYETVHQKWNAGYGVSQLLRFLRTVALGCPEGAVDGPMKKAPIISPKKGYEYTRL
ncbi:MAG: glycosyltransferase family 4 protein [Lachnospiraceae bacterium]